MTPKDRLLMYAKTKNISKREFGRRSGLSETYIETVKENITSKTRLKIERAFPDLNMDWVITGEGDMLVSEKESKDTQEETPYIVTPAGMKFYKMSNGYYRMRVPFIPVNAYAGYLESIQDAEYVEWDKEYDFVVKDIHHGSYAAFEITGHSMDDGSKRSVSDGDVVLARELSRDKWAPRLFVEKFPFWILVTEANILCKEICEQDFAKGVIKCHSLNPSPEYSDFPLELDNIRKLYNIVQKTTTSF